MSGHEDKMDFAYVQYGLLLVVNLSLNEYMTKLINTSNHEKEQKVMKLCFKHDWERVDSSHFIPRTFIQECIREVVVHNDKTGTNSTELAGKIVELRSRFMDPIYDYVCLSCGKTKPNVSAAKVSIKYELHSFFMRKAKAEAIYEKSTKG